MEKKTQNNWGLLEASMEFAKTNPFGALIGWIVIIILALQVSGLSIGTITDKWFWLEEKKIDQSYELQVKTLDFLQTEVMWKLDEIYKRLDTVEEDVAESKLDIKDLENRVQKIENEHE